MIRWPESALTLAGVLRGLKASAKPSVTRVEANTALAARNAAKLVRSSGSGEPLGEQTILPACPAYSPRVGKPTPNWLTGNGRDAAALKASCAMTAPCPAGNCATFPRILAILSTTEPAGESLNDTPWKVSELELCNIPGTPEGCGPEPLSTVSATSVALLLLILFVIGTLKNTVTSPLICRPEDPPEQLSTMSPTRSV